MHALTRDCPLTCLERLLSAPAYRALHAGSPGPHPTIGSLVDLYRSKQITSLRRIGVKRSLVIETCLSSAGLISRPSGRISAQELSVMLAAAGLPGETDAAQALRQLRDPAGPGAAGEVSARRYQYERTSSGHWMHMAAR